MRKIKKLTAWISRKIKKLAILTCICGILQYFLAKIKKLADYFSAKIKKLTGWIFDKFLIKKTVCIFFAFLPFLSAGRLVNFNFTVFL